MNYIKQSISKIRLMIQSQMLHNFRRVEKWQWLEQEHLLTLQRERLGRVLAHAYNNTHYYNEILGDAGVVNTYGKVNLNKFQHVPFLTKNTMRNRFDDLISFDLGSRKWRHNTSGGSTGEPIKIVLDREYDYWNRAMKLLHNSWTGFVPGSGEARLWTSRRDAQDGQETISTYVSRWLNSELWLNASRMTPEQMREYVEQINTMKPAQIQALAETIYDLSCLMEREGLTICPPRAIISSSGALHPHMRETVERVFKAPVFDRYGSRETGNIAFECREHDGLHVSAPTHYVEILRGDGTRAEPGEAGEIVVTALTNYAMPIIRYRLEDMGAWADHECTCGRSWPRIENIAGRVQENHQDKGLIC